MACFFWDVMQRAAQQLARIVKQLVYCCKQDAAHCVAFFRTNNLFNLLTQLRITSFSYFEATAPSRGERTLTRYTYTPRASWSS